MNAQILITSDAEMRKGYEAPRWRWVSRIMARKFVTVATEVIAEGK